MFHLRNGLFFERTKNGQARIVITSDGLARRPDNCLMDLSVSFSEFASVMASMCPEGETSKTYAQALAFISPPYPGDYDAVRMSWRPHPPCECGRYDYDHDHKPHKDCPLWKHTLEVRAAWPMVLTRPAKNEGEQS